MTGTSSHFGAGAGVAVGATDGAVVGWVVGDEALVAAVSVRPTLSLEHATNRTASASEATRSMGCMLV